MGTDTIQTATDGTAIPADHHNSIKGALTVDLLPRNSSGVVTDEAGDLGSSTYEWKAAYVKDAEFSGDINVLGNVNVNGINSYLPSGLISAYSGQTAPDGWLFADGSTIGPTGSGATYTGNEYETLFELIKFGYSNAGTESWSSGSDTVLLPDCRGMFLRGKDRSKGLDPQGDSTEGTYRADILDAHTHQQTVTDVSGKNPIGATYGSGTGSSTSFSVTGTSSGPNASSTPDQHTASSGSSETAPKHMVLNHIIKI
jgi:microcystin-dependent protein